MVNQIPPGSHVLDLATGTGEVAFLEHASGHAVAGIDFSRLMLAKAREKDPRGSIQWVLGSADCLPFGNQTFGCVTSAFALRNFGSLVGQVFKESFRVLKTGGRALHLDFGRPTSRLSRWGHRLHLRAGIPLIGRWICGELWPKQYLEKTIEFFYDPAEVEKRLADAGFSDVHHTSFCCGAVVLYQGTKQ